jgi:hypothetical protein
MNAFIEEKRKTDPDFVFAKDGVHANDVGHALMAGELVRGISPASGPWFQKLKASAWFQSPAAKNVTAMIRKRGRLLADAWLTDTGHLRPGMAKGLPVDQATAQAAELGQQIRAAIAENPPPQ